MTSPPRIFDRAAARLRRRRAARSAHQPDFLYARVAEDVAERVAVARRGFSRVLEIGARGDRLRARFPSDVGHDGWLRVSDAAQWGDVVGEPELSPAAPQAFDLAVSVFGLHDVNDLPGALVQIRYALKPDGLFLAALPGPATLSELRRALVSAEAEIRGGAGPRVHPFIDVRDGGALLQRAGFALPVTDVDRVTVRYARPEALIDDLRAMGETNVLAARERRPLSPSVLARALEIYADREADSDGRVRATFEIVHLAGWAPHESQQKPLRPGSARMRLADALGVEERSTGESAGPPRHDEGARDS